MEKWGLPLHLNLATLLEFAQFEMKLYLADFDRNAALLYPFAYRSKITISEFALNYKFFKRTSSQSSVDAIEKQ